MTAVDVQQLLGKERWLAAERANLRLEFAKQLNRGKQGLVHSSPAGIASDLGLGDSVDSVEDWFAGTSVPGKELWEKLFLAWEATVGADAAQTLRSIYDQLKVADGEWRSIRANLRNRGIDINEREVQYIRGMEEDNPASLAWDGRSPAYEWVQAHIVYLIGRNRIPEGSVERRTLRARQDGLRWVRIANQAEPPARPKYRMDFEVLSGGGAVFEKGDAGYLNCFLQLDPPLNDGEEHTVFTRRVYTGDKVEAPPYCWYVPGPYVVRELILGARFDAEAMPTRTWWFEGIRTHMVEGMSLIAEHELSISGITRTVEHRFSNPIFDRGCGIAWEW